MAGKTHSIEIYKGGGAFGFTVGGGKDNPIIPGSKSLYVTSINKYGSAAEDGRLRVGDEILEVNSIKLNDRTHKEAVEIFNNAGETITLKVFSSPENQLLVEQKEGARKPKKTNQAYRVIRVAIFLVSVGAAIAFTYRRIKN